MNWVAVYSLVALVAMYAAASVILKQVGGHAPDWQARCTKCGSTRNAGRAGIVRIRAASLGKVVLGYCSQCKTMRWLAIEHSAAGAERAPTGTARR
jgi:hypothetical protein